jgi:hypothetical protein
MGTNQVGRGRSVGVGQQELELRLPKRSDNSSDTNVVFQRGTPDVTRLRRQAISTPQKIQAAQQGLAGHIGTAMSPNTQAVATGAIKNTDMASSSGPSQANAPIKQQPSQAINFNDGTDALQEELRNATCALMKKFPDKMPLAKSFWEARLTKPDEYKLFESFAKAARTTDDLEFLKTVIDFKNNPTAEYAQDIVEIFIEVVPTNHQTVILKDSSRMQLNLVSDDVRNKLILAVKTCISELSADQEHVREQAQSALPKLFDSAESYINKVVFRDNLGPMLMQEVKNEIRLQKVAQNNIPASPLSFA